MKTGRCSTGRAWRILVAMLAGFVCESAVVAAPIPLGAWGRWGALRDGERCWAVTRPVASTRGHDAAPALTVARRAGGAPELHLTLSRPAAGRRVRLSIGGRAIGLVASGAEAHALHARADASIITAMRGADTLVLAGRDAGGRPFRDVYRLAGAASAIDAAMLGCLK